MKREKFETWIRLGKGFTQKQLAAEIGVSQPTVGKALRGDVKNRLAEEIRFKALKEYGGVEYNIRPLNW